ncbi:MAG: AgmX/PglI C-terminal domain-containing protein [Kofleriaceae bacterium]
MRAVFRMVIAVSLAACPDEKPIDLSSAKNQKAAAMPSPRIAPSKPRPTMPGGRLPFDLPAAEGPSLAFAPQLVLFDHNILRKPTSPANTYAGTATPYVRPTSATPVAVYARLDSSAGAIALYVNKTSSAIETLYLLDDLKQSQVAFAVQMSTRYQLPYLFGAADQNVRDRLQIDVTSDEITIGDDSFSTRDVAKIGTAVLARRGQSTVGIEARVGIRAGTSNQTLASVVSALASAKVEALHLYPVMDSVAHSSTSYADSRRSVPSVRIGQPNAQGDLDKAIIRRYIKRNVQKLQYCYEKELLVMPDLSGTVATQFFISPNGTVSQADASGVAPKVASCIADVIRNIEFPKPKGGGGVQVNYPFMFRPYGG